MKLSRHVLVVHLLLGFGVAAPGLAQTSVDGEVRAMDNAASRQGEAKVQQRIAADFAVFAGSEANAASLVSGLRSGDTITLGSTEFTPPTRPMGNGNVYLSLALAKEQLAAQGIAEPTPQQLQAALMGGTVTTGNPPRTVELKGVLQLRSEGMGWGQIAQAYGVKLGPVMAGMKSANQSLVVPAPAGSSSGSPQAAAPSTSAISTAAGTKVRGSGHGIVSAAGADSAGRGIVTAGGGHGIGAGQARGVTTAAGARVRAGGPGKRNEK